MKRSHETERPTELLRKLEEHRVTYQELVVESGHSLQDHPETVEEVRRILLYHARDVP